MLTRLFHPALVSRGFSNSLRVRCVITSSLSLQQVATTPQAKPFNAIPGPKPLPLIGNLLDMYKTSKEGKSLQDFFSEGLKKYGGIMRLSVPGASSMVVVADPDVLEEVLRAEGKYPMREPDPIRMQWFYQKAGRPPGFFFENGEKWKTERSATIKQTLPAYVNSFIDGFNRVYFRFTDYLRKTRNEGNLIEDVTPLIQRIAMEATGKFVFDVDMDLLMNPNEEDVKFIEHVNNLMEGWSRVMYDPLIRHKLYHNKDYHFVLKAIEGSYSHGANYAYRIMDELKHGEKSNKPVRGMLEHWLSDKKMTTEQAVGLSTMMFIAGIHTTANQSTFLLYHMAKNPEAQERLYQEIQTVLGDKPPTAQDLGDMKYMRGCIMESMRLKPTIPGTARVLEKDAIIMGYQVPAGVR